MVKRLNLHIDEPGNQDLSEGRRLLTVVLHDHSEDVDEAIGRYEVRFASGGILCSRSGVAAGLTERMSIACA